MPENTQATRRRPPARGVVAVLAVVALVAIAVAVPFTPAMPVRTIEVEGERQLSSDEIIAATSIEEGTPIARVDVQQAASDVAGLPWVKSATVGRSWPSTIAVTVEEHVAVAYADTPEGSRLIDTRGEEFVVADPPEGAVQLAGSALENERVRRDAVAIVTSISEEMRGRVASIEASSPSTFVLRLDDDRRVVWGASKDNDNKARALETVVHREGAEFNISNPELVTVR
ncbi:cell division protein FtsQ/DivIB [Corynebacterium timonense]|uniref:Cell division protein FtsQ n=1 Tax=Corynebacterium timonense TaxID=441500 RepID=A0A1H1MLT0_9CORY|nr:FtsQ-type POTRA domain-containing protein [Corynebacterium timonense]SDR87771.1 cell division protein FtsQ [Corynebacterium timonense]